MILNLASENARPSVPSAATQIYAGLESSLEGARLRIHVLGIAGGIVGLGSLVTTWISVTGPEGTEFGTAFDVFDLITLLAPAFDASPGLGLAIILMVVAVLLAIIGTVVAFFHPIGGAFLVAAGLSGTIGAIWLGRALLIVPGASASLGIGVVLSLAAGAAALGGYGTPRLVLWPRPTPGPAPLPGSPGIAETPVLAPPTDSAPDLPPPSPGDVLPSAALSPSAPEPGWVVGLQKEIRGVEEAIVAERISLSRIETAVADGNIDSPTSVELARDHSERIAALERHLARKRSEEERAGDPPPPPD